MPDGRALFWVMIGGALGAATRFLLGAWVQRKYGAAFPWGTLLINLTGCFVLGVFVGLRSGGRYVLPAFLTPAFGVGFVGAYTTFSTFAVEAVALVEGRNVIHAFLYVGASVLVGLGAALAGILAGRQV